MVRPIRVRAAPSEGLSAVGSRSHGGEETHAYLKAFEIADFVAAGSSLKLCLLAEGKADIYPRMGRTMEWDIAAGDAILRAAGGRVETLDGQALRYGKRDQSADSDFANPHFVAFGDPAIRA
jgi:3'(2'), 5'-bisphosphate nucleotidase